MFHFTLFIKDVLQNCWRTTVPIISAPYINFSRCTKEHPHGPVFLEDQYYQRQFFAKIFPSTLALTLQIHFHPSLSGIILDRALKVIALKSATFSAHESAPETNLETTHFMPFLKNLTKNLEKKLVIKFVLME